MLRQISNDTIFNSTKHHPDCSSVSDAQLQKTIFARWPIEEGVAKIRYSLSTSPFWLAAFPRVLYNFFILHEPIINTKSILSPVHLDEKAQNQLRNSLKFSLNQWAAVSDGTIEIVEATTVYPWSRGIYFFVVNPDAIGNGVTAFTLRSLDNNGEIKQAFVFLPNNKIFWNEENKLLLPHEEGHIFGGEHFHLYPDIQRELENTPDGVFCSVMPYPGAISTNTSACHIEYPGDCQPPYADSPGPLDKEWIRLAYKANRIADIDPSGRRVGDYILNALGAFFSSAAISGLHKAMISLLSNLAIHPNKPLIPEKVAKFIVDTGLLAAVIYLEFPIGTIAIYAACNITKYLPNSILDRLPTGVKFIFTSNYGVWMLNFSSACLQGQKIFPWVGATLLSACGSLIGTAMGYALGKGSAWLINLIPQTITAKYCNEQPVAIQEIELQELNLIDNEDDAVNDNTDIIIDIHDDETDDMMLDLIDFYHKEEKKSAVTNMYSFFSSNFAQIGTWFNLRGQNSDPNNSQALLRSQSHLSV